MVDSPDRTEELHARLVANARYRDQVQGRPTHKLELYQGQEAATNVLRYRVVRLDRQTFRAVVLIERSNPVEFLTYGHDGSRDTCRAFLTSHGVPVLRIGGPITQAH